MCGVVGDSLGKVFGLLELLKMNERRRVTGSQSEDILDVFNGS